MEKAKEKAIEIFTTINKKLADVDTYHSLDCYVKELAIYQCDEIKKYCNHSDKEYWDKVKEEIKNYNTH